MQKKGELTSTQIIMLVLAIAGFIIILLFLLFLKDIYNQTDVETCRLSVLSRATVPEATQQAIPLKCTTLKYCLTTTGQDCLQFSPIEKPIKITLPKDTQQAARKVEEISANALYDCWSMMGQGKLSIFGQEGSLLGNVAEGVFGVPSKVPKCVICSRVALASDLKNRSDILGNVSLSRYLENTLVPNSRYTYLQTFTDNQINQYPQQFKDQINANVSNSTDQISFIFMQVLATDSPALQQAISSGANTGLGILGGASISPIGLGTMKIRLGVASAGTLISGGLAYYKASENQRIIAHTCQNLRSPIPGQAGCSLVTPLDYNDLKSINALCEGGIEGSPY